MEGYIRPAAAGGVPGASLRTIHRWHITAWTRCRGWTLAQIVEEPATSSARSALEALFERVESGERDGLVVARLSQLGGSLRDAVEAIERIQAAGGAFVSVRDGIDSTTPAGQRDLRLLMAALWW